MKASLIHYMLNERDFTRKIADNFRLTNLLAYESE